jgi:hypothetical protein
MVLIALCRQNPRGCHKSIVTVSVLSLCHPHPKREDGSVRLGEKPGRRGLPGLQTPKQTSRPGLRHHFSPSLKARVRKPARIRVTKPGEAQEGIEIVLGSRQPLTLPGTVSWRVSGLPARRKGQPPASRGPRGQN